MTTTFSIPDGSGEFPRGATTANAAKNQTPVATWPNLLAAIQEGRRVNLENVTLAAEERIREIFERVPPEDSSIITESAGSPSDADGPLVTILRLRLALIHSLARSAPEVFEADDDWLVLNEHIDDTSRFDRLLGRQGGRGLLSLTARDYAATISLHEDFARRDAKHENPLLWRRGHIPQIPRKIFRRAPEPLISESEMLSPIEQGIGPFATPPDVMAQQWPSLQRVPLHS